MTNTSGKYSTAFMIDSLKDEQEKYAVYLKHKKVLSDVIISELTAAEDKIRSIGFYGSDKSFDKLFWLLIYRFCNFQKIPFATDEALIRPDGGKYFPLGFDRTEDADIEKVVDTALWAYNGSMCNDNFWWFGLYNFGKSEIEDMMDEYTAEWKRLHEMLCTILHSDFDISWINEDEKYILAKLVEKGFLRIHGTKALPNFCVFTSEQYRKLEEIVFVPIAKKLENEITALADDLSKLCRKKMPAQHENYYNLFVRIAMCDIGYLTTIFAFDEKQLYIPKDSHDGEFLTLMYIRK